MVAAPFRRNDEDKDGPQGFEAWRPLVSTVGAEAGERRHYSEQRCFTFCCLSGTAFFRQKRSCLVAFAGMSLPKNYNDARAPVCARLFSCWRAPVCVFGGYRSSLGVAFCVSARGA